MRRFQGTSKVPLEIEVVTPNIYDNFNINAKEMLIINP